MAYITKDQLTENVRQHMLIGFSFAIFILIFFPYIMHYRYHNQSQVSALILFSALVSVGGYLLSKRYPKRSIDIANYEFIFYTVTAGLIIHYLSLLNGPLIFLYGLLVLAAAYFLNAKYLTYLSGVASIFVFAEYFILIQSGTLEFSLTGLAFVLLRVLYLALLAQVGRNLGLDIATQKKEYTKLIHLNKELGEMDRVKCNFVDVASHQLKTPLTVVKGNASMILEGDFGTVNSKLKSPLKEINMGSERLTDIINNVVDTLKYEKNLPINLELRMVDLKKVVAYEVYSFLSESWAKKIRIDFKEEKKVSPFLADLEKVKLALSIYLENALIRSLKGSKIEIHLDEKGKEATIEVVDYGPKVFDADKLFKGADKFDSTKKSLAANLYVVKRLIESHKGKVYYRENEGEGNLFGFTLPTERVEKKNRKRIGAR